MPRLVLTFRRVLEIIEKAGFVPHGSPKAGSHRRYRAVIDGQVRFVDVCGHKPSDEVAPGTLASIIRQSGLGKKAFRP